MARPSFAGSGADSCGGSSSGRASVAFEGSFIVPRNPPHHHGLSSMAPAAFKPRTGAIDCGSEGAVYGAMSSDPSPRAPVNFVDNRFAPDVFATTIAGLHIANGNITITLQSTRIDHSTSPAPVNHVVVARVVMPVPTAQSLSLQLVDFLKKQGHDPVEAATRGQTAQ